MRTFGRIGQLAEVYNREHPSEDSWNIQIDHQHVCLVHMINCQDGEYAVHIFIGPATSDFGEHLQGALLDLPKDASTWTDEAWGLLSSKFPHQFNSAL